MKLSSVIWASSSRSAKKKGVDVFECTDAAGIYNLNDVVVVGYGQQKKVVSSVSVVSGEDLHVSSKKSEQQQLVKFPVCWLFSVRENRMGWLVLEDTWCEFLCRRYRSVGHRRRCTCKMNDIDVDEISRSLSWKMRQLLPCMVTEGANGVVLITSKQNQIQRTKISAVICRILVSTPLRLPSLLDSYSYLSLLQWGKNGTMRAIQNLLLMPFSDEILENTAQVQTLIYPNANWMDAEETHRKSTLYSHQFPRW